MIQSVSYHLNEMQKMRLIHFVVASLCQLLFEV